MTTAQDTAAPVHTHDHVHGAEAHSHDDADHQHGTGEEKRGQLGLGAPMLDIGGDIGALLLYTSEDLEGQEIEVSLTSEPDHRTHTEVHRRTVGGSTFWAGVYAELPEGDYRVWYDDPAGDTSFTITGGAVSELDWR